MNFVKFLTCNSTMKLATALLVVSILSVLLAIAIPQCAAICVVAGLLAIIHCIAFSIKGTIELYSHE